MTRHATATTVLASARAVYGLTLLARPAPLVHLVAGARPRPWELRLVRVLGARHLAQAVATARNADRATLTVGAEVDVLHVGSLVAVAVASPTHRRIACADAVVASALAVASMVVARRAHPTHAVGRLPETLAERLEDRRNAFARRLVRRTAPPRARR